jgi:hypothetical protein
MLGWILYFAMVFGLVWLCAVVPIIGYPLAFIFVLRLLFSGGRTSKPLDTETLDDSHQHHHH